MKRYVLWMTLSLIADLKAMALDKRTSVSALVREACEKAVREWREGN